MTDEPLSSKRKTQPQTRSQGQAPAPEPGSSQSQPSSTQASSTQHSAGQSQPGAKHQQEPQKQPEQQRQSAQGKQPVPEKQQPGKEPEPRSQFNIEVAQQCIDLVEAYRRGERSRGWVTLTLANKLGIRGKPDDDPAAISALDTYCAQVNEIDNARKAALPRSQQGSRESSPGGDQAEGSARDRSRTLRKSKGKRRADRSRSPSRSRSSRRSRSRSLSPLALSEDEPSSKRQKPDATEYPWSTSNALAEKTLRPDVLETLECLRKYAKDIRFAKSNLLNSMGAPEFPDAEWGNILRGKPVDLDHVFSGQYSLGIDEKHTEKFGPLELSYRAVTPAKTIKCAGDWVIAWHKTTAAYLYVFPHRKLELEGYYAHIFSLFGSIHPDYHYRVLDYDRAARKKAAAVHTILLTDLHEFSFLRTLHIDSIGASVVTTHPAPAGTKKGSGTSRRAPSNEACRRWNRGICNATDSACKYVHRCSTCGSSGHPATGCTKDGKRK